MECKSGDLGCCDYHHYFVLPVAHKHICTQLIADLQWKLSSHLSLTCGTIYISVWNFMLYSWNALLIIRLVHSPSKGHFHSCLLILLTCKSTCSTYRNFCHDITTYLSELPTSKCLCCSTEVRRWAGFCCHCSKGRFSTRTTVSSTVWGLGSTCGCGCLLSRTVVSSTLLKYQPCFSDISNTFWGNQWHMAYKYIHQSFV